MVIMDFVGLVIGSVCFRVVMVYCIYPTHPKEQLLTFKYVHNPFHHF